MERKEYRRNHGFFGHSRPNHFLIIGDSVNSDVIFLDTTQENGPVLVASHGLSTASCAMAITKAWKDE